MNTHRLFVLLLLTSLLVISLYPFQSVQAADGIAIVDQTHIVDCRFGCLHQSVQYFSPVGQSFTPTIPGLDAVDLWTEDFANGNGYGAELYVNIREATIDGTIVGTSDTLQLPDNFPFHQYPFSYGTHFTFPSLISLTPGEVYVIEVVVIGGLDWEWIALHNWGVASFGYADSPGYVDYPGGMQIVNGTEISGSDLWFQEGLATSIPQTREYCKNGLWAYLSRADGSSFKNTGECMKYVQTGK
jgi:hypothetical protein